MTGRAPDEIWELLDSAVRQQLDELVLANEHIVMRLARHRADVPMSISEMKAIESFRYSQLSDRIRWKPERPDRDEMEQALVALASNLTGLEAAWDGDSYGWFVDLSADTRNGRVHLGRYQGHGGDMRLLNGQVPPWPEEAWARADGNHLAELMHVPFRFDGDEGPDRHVG